MSGNIKAIRGGFVPGRADPDMIRRLEGLLEDARAGRLSGFIYAGTNGDLSIQYGWSGVSSFSLLGAANAVTHKMQALLMEGE